MQPDAIPVCLMPDDFTHQGESALPNSLLRVGGWGMGGGVHLPSFANGVHGGGVGVGWLQKMKFILILTNLC